jgi:class II lanthipeptide synthase
MAGAHEARLPLSPSMLSNMLLDQDPVWQLAQSLPERAALLRRRGKRLTNDGFDYAIGRVRSQRWSSEAPFDRPSELTRRLRSAGCNSQTFSRALAATAEGLADLATAPPPWTSSLDDLLPGCRSRPAPRSPATLGKQKIEGLAALVEPLLEHSLARLRADVGACCNGPNALLRHAGEVGTLFRPYLRWLLLRLATPTLVLELNVARLEKRLGGTTGERRFASFCASLRQRSTALRTFREYPVLARLLVTVAEDFVAAATEMIQRAYGDQDDLCRLLGQSRPLGPLVELRPGLGDRHRRGRTVAKLTFSSGLTVFYKPRSLGVDLHFQDLLTWMNDRGFTPEFEVLRVIDRGDYGWTEAVVPQVCSTPAAVRRFYRRLGGHLALLYLLGGTDVHLENLIACGEQPKLVDLETLLHPQPAVASSSLNGVHSNALVNSVLRVGLLPERYWGEDEFSGVELSGLAGRGGQADVVPSRFWERVGSDDMRAVQLRAELRDGENRPHLGEKPVDGLAYRRSFEAGFVSAYELLRANRAALAGPESPLACFACDEVRFLLRPTRVYQVILEKGLHPDFLRDAVDRDWLFDRLWIPEAGEAESSNRFGELFGAELDDMRADCVPLFFTRAGSCDLCSSTGDRIRGYFPSSALDLARRRVGALSANDLERQLWLIRAAFAKLSGRGHRVEAARSGQPRRGRERAATCDPDRLVDAACRIGDRLADLSIRGEGRSGWFTVVPNDDYSRWAIKVTGLDLYRGLPGILLFLASLQATSGRERYGALAADVAVALDDVIAEYDAVGADMNRTDWIGAFHGWGGPAYALASAFRHTGDEKYLSRAQAIARRLGPLIPHDRAWGVDRGAAGALLALLGLDDVAPEPWLAELARHCGDHLLAQADHTPEGPIWSQAAKHRNGACNGSAEIGIALALRRLGARLEDDRYLSLGASIVTRGAARHRVSRHLDPVAWCRGILPFALASTGAVAAPRARLLRRFASAAADARTVRDHSLCHGLAGRLELLLALATRCNDEGSARHAAQIASILATAVERRTWICGEVGGAEVPGLLTGLAGIGYSLLRAAFPARLPSILTLDPPTGRQLLT